MARKAFAGTARNITQSMPQSKVRVEAIRETKAVNEQLHTLFDAARAKSYSDDLNALLEYAMETTAFHSDRARVCNMTAMVHRLGSALRDTEASFIKLIDPSRVAWCDLFEAIEEGDAARALLSANKMEAVYSEIADLLPLELIDMYTKEITRARAQFGSK